MRQLRLPQELDDGNTRLLPHMPRSPHPSMSTAVGDIFPAITLLYRRLSVILIPSLRIPLIVHSTSLTAASTWATRRRYFSLETDLLRQ
jgi:hypothetical protein